MLIINCDYNVPPFVCVCVCMYLCVCVCVCVWQVAWGNAHADLHSSSRKERCFFFSFPFKKSNRHPPVSSVSESKFFSSVQRMMCSIQKLSSLLNP